MTLSRGIYIGYFMKCNIMEPMISENSKIRWSATLIWKIRSRYVSKRWVKMNKEVYRLYERKEVVFVTSLIETTHIIIH